MRFSAAHSSFVVGLNGEINEFEIKYIPPE